MLTKNKQRRLLREKEVLSADGEPERESKDRAKPIAAVQTKVDELVAITNGLASEIERDIVQIENESVEIIQRQPVSLPKKDHH